MAEDPGAANILPRVSTSSSRPSFCLSILCLCAMQEMAEDPGVANILGDDLDAEQAMQETVGEEEGLEGQEEEEDDLEMDELAEREEAALEKQRVDQDKGGCIV